MWGAASAALGDSGGPGSAPRHGPSPLASCMSWNSCHVLECSVLDAATAPGPASPWGSAAGSVAGFGNFLGPNLWSLSLRLRSPNPGSLPSDRLSEPPRVRGCGSPPEPASRTGWRHLRGAHSPGPPPAGTAPLTRPLSLQCLAGSCSPRSRMQKARRSVL